MCADSRIITSHPRRSSLRLGETVGNQRALGVSCNKSHQHTVNSGSFFSESMSVCVSYRIVECRPARVMPFPVMGDGRVLPPWRSSMERLQGLDLSITASGLFSTQSPSNLAHHEDERRNEKKGTLKPAVMSLFKPIKTQTWTPLNVV